MCVLKLEARNNLKMLNRHNMLNSNLNLAGETIGTLSSDEGKVQR